MNRGARLPAVVERCLSGALCAALLGVGACKDEPPAGPSVGTNSNWLRACASRDECGDLPACECGACTARCTGDDECAAIDDARCALGADPAAWAECESRSPALSAGLCLPRCDPGSCGDGQACVSGACVLAPLPEVAFCADAAAADAGLRTREEELLALLQALRTTGDSRCPAGDAPGASAVPALRYDARLVCAARVLARDLDATRDPGLMDSQGRTTPQRLMAAGYTPRSWGESFALDARSAAHALELMLSGDSGACARLRDADNGDVGVGGFGDTLVVTIGGE
jgi:hypothetical protein